VRAPAHWRCIEFISDLHLQDSQPETLSIWRHYLQHTQADALFILGDLFELWVGDDACTTTAGTTPSFEQACRHELAQVAQRLSVFFMHGNRDFLLGPDFAQAAHMQLLNDPAVLCFDARRWLLSHGDALCLDDTDYQQFRAQVRTPRWQQEFLQRPLAQRLTMGRALRAQSEARKASGAPYADVDTVTARQWLQAFNASTLIHGHTHRPVNHVLDAGPPPLTRLVLSDWDAAARPPRAQILRLQSGALPQRVDLISGLQ